MASVLSAPHFHYEDAAYAYVEARLWPNGPVCPHCGATSDKIGRLDGRTTRVGLRKCYACRKPFTIKIGTVFEDSHCPLRYWLQAIHLIFSSKKGISTRQLQRTLGVGMKTAWLLGHRIRAMMKRDDGVSRAPLGGNGSTVEADFTYVGRKPGTKVRRGARQTNPVFALVERDGSARCSYVPSMIATRLHTVIAHHAARDSHFMTEESPTFAGIGWNFPSHDTI